MSLVGMLINYKKCITSEETSGGCGEEVSAGVGQVLPDRRHGDFGDQERMRDAANEVLGRGAHQRRRVRGVEWMRL